MSCATCPHLVKSKYKEERNKCRLYGCNASLTGYVEVWISDDYLLEDIGCELDEKQMSINDILRE